MSEPAASLMARLMAARRLELLVAEDYGGGMDALPLEPVAQALERLLA